MTLDLIHEILNDFTFWMRVNVLDFHKIEFHELWHIRMALPSIGAEKYRTLDKILLRLQLFSHYLCTRLVSTADQWLADFWKSLIHKNKSRRTDVRGTFTKNNLFLRVRLLAKIPTT